MELLEKRTMEKPQNFTRGAGRELVPVPVLGSQPLLCGPDLSQQQSHINVLSIGKTEKTFVLTFHKCVRVTWISAKILN